MKTIVLNLTSDDRRNTPVMIVSNSITIHPPFDEKNKAGCRVRDRMHNNGGWDVTESFEEVKRMILDQLGGDALTENAMLRATLEGIAEGLYIDPKLAAMTTIGDLDC